MGEDTVYSERFGGITCAACRREICAGEDAIRTEAELGGGGRSYHAGCPPDGKSVRENRS